MSERCEDTIYRQAAIDALDCINGVEEVLRSLPSAQPDLSEYSDKLWRNAYERGKREAQSEIKPIEYRDCANAMLRMWIDKVLTDGEYNRIMDKLNAHWTERREDG